MYFDGVLGNDYVDFGDIHLLSGLDDFTLSALINTNDGSARNIICSEKDNGYDGFIFSIAAHRIELLFSDYGDSWDIVACSETDLADNTWYYVAVTVNLSSSAITFYVDGVEDGTVVDTADPLPADSGNFRIGCQEYYNYYNFNGEIKNVVVFAGELTAAEIAILHDV